jgi:hypothetical protein
MTHTHVLQHDTEIQQLQTSNQETTAESNAYSDRITTLQNELNHDCANGTALQAAATVADAALRQ